MLPLPVPKFPLDERLNAVYALMPSSNSCRPARVHRFWVSVGEVLATFAEEKKTLWGFPSDFVDSWNQLQPNRSRPDCNIWLKCSPHSNYGTPCVSLYADCNSGTFSHPKLGFEAKFIAYRIHGMLKVEPLSEAREEGLLSNFNPPLLRWPFLTIAGMGSSGAMRLSPILRLWNRKSGRWHLVQSVLHEVFGGDGYFLPLRRSAASYQLVMKVPTSTSLDRDENPVNPRRTRIEIWKFRSGRYRLKSSYWLRDAFLNFERFVLAIESNHPGIARLYGDSKSTCSAKRLLTKLSPPFRIHQVSDSGFDIFEGVERSDFVIRFTETKISGRWRVTGVKRTKEQ
jgi:hypothetical protein